MLINYSTHPTHLLTQSSTLTQSALQPLNHIRNYPPTSCIQTRVCAVCHHFLTLVDIRHCFQSFLLA
uniref:Phorbol-ester/DAG-type domain-containing protein n=1 Tax=Mesocestoides corti TaxID=53468 RepID=A0A5K3G078_MESCO